MESTRAKISIEEIVGPYSSGVSANEKNTASAAAKEFLNRTGKRAIVKLKL